MGAPPPACAPPRVDAPCATRHTPHPAPAAPAVGSSVVTRTGGTGILVISAAGTFDYESR